MLKIISTIEKGLLRSKNIPKTETTELKMWLLNYETFSKMSIKKSSFVFIYEDSRWQVREKNEISAQTTCKYDFFFSGNEIWLIF